MVSAKSHASNGICSETFHKILSANGIKERCTIFGGSDSHTRDMFCLPQDVPLPLRHYKIAFPVKVDVKAVISSFKMAIGEDIGNHTICPEAASGNRKEHMFFVFMSSNLKSSLKETYQNDEQTKQHLSVVYEASQPIINTSSDITPSQRLCALVLLYSFIMFTANARALRTRGTCSGPLKDIDIALKKDCKRSKSQILREAQRSLLKKAYAAYQSNLQQPQDSTATGVANPQEHACTQCKSSGNFHGSPDSVLPNGKRQRLVEPTVGGTRAPDRSSSDATVSEQFPGHPQEVVSPISEIEAANILSEIGTKHL